MPSHTGRSVPIVVIANISESFYDFLSREEHPERKARLIRERQVKGDRALLWMGDPKLVEYLRERLGYEGTYYMTPAAPSPHLSLDILREPPLIERLVDYAGADRAVQLIPYATTREFFQLVESLQTDHGLEVNLPESPKPDCLWLREYVDTKSGFRMLASEYLTDSDRLLPKGIVCRDLPSAAEVVRWFSNNGQASIVKADDGEGGIGQYKHSGRNGSTADILRRLQAIPLLRTSRCVVVEEFIVSSNLLYPSLEVFVPPHGCGKPEVTYICNQLFLESGTFTGVLLSRELSNSKWHAQLVDRGLLIATNLQKAGYIGHFDLDAIVSNDERLILLEVNGRRTGGTHVHEFARFHFGPNYLDDLVLLSHDDLDSAAITQLDDLLSLLDDLLYPMEDEGREGVIITLSSTLVDHRFGSIVVASSTDKALSLQGKMRERIEKASRDGLGVIAHTFDAA